MKNYLDDKENEGWIRMPKDYLFDTRFKWAVVGFILGAFGMTAALMYHGAL